MKQRGPWTFGGLANHLWSLESGDLNATFLQPFVSYTTPSALTFGVNVEVLFNWNSEEWQVPVNATVSRVISLRGEPVSLTAGVGYYADGPATGPEGWPGGAGGHLPFP